MAATQDNPKLDWQRLISTAVLGTERAGAAPQQVDPGLQTLLDRSATDSPQTPMLNAAALLSVYHKAGQRFPSTARTDDKPIAHDRPECSLRAGRHLLKILSNKDWELLDEWCRAAIAAGFRAPDELLPSLLDQIVAQRSLARREPIAPVIGERGRWLANQHPQWKTLIASSGDAETIWQTGAREERMALLAAMRSTQPKAARELLASTWDQETPNDREAFVELLGKGLSLDDEAFLEKGLDDSRKPVRTAAARLLACLIDSAFCLRMRERALPLLKFTSSRSGLLKRKAASLEVTLPDKCDKPMIRDGIESKTRSKLGPNAAMMCQILAATPLTTWTETWNVEPAEILAAAAKSEWKDALVTGWATAAARQSNAAWADAILAGRLLDEAAAGAQAGETVDLVRDLLNVLAPAAREAFLSTILKGKPFPFHRHPVLGWLQAYDSPWSEDLSRLVLAVLQQHYKRHSDGYDYVLRKVVAEEFARRMPPHLASEAANGWPTNVNTLNDGNTQMVDTLVSTLQSRRDFLMEFHS